MNIVTKLHKAITDHAAKTGQKASRIYLGRLQMRELEMWVDQRTYYINGPGMKVKNRIEYYDAPVFEVDDDDHFNVS